MNYRIYLKPFIFLLVMGLLTCILIFVTSFTLTYNPTKVSNLFIKDISSGDTIGAYSLTANDFKKLKTQTDFSQFISDFKLDDIKDINWSGKEVNGNNASLIGDIKFKSSEVSKQIVLYLIYEDNTWKIDGIDI